MHKNVLLFNCVTSLSESLIIINMYHLEIKPGFYKAVFCTLNNGFVV